MVNELKVGYVDYRKTGSVLINEFLLFQYSQAIFSDSISALAMKLAQDVHTLTIFLMYVKLAGKSPFSRIC